MISSLGNIFLRLLIVMASGLMVPCVMAQEVRPEIVTSGLEHPWGLAFLPGGRFLVTERPGRLRVVSPNGTMSVPVTGLPEIAAGGQGGLLDVITDSNFVSNRRVYFCFSERAADGRTNSTALARATLSVDNARLENVKVIFSQKPKVASSAHFGCRIVESHSSGTSATNTQPDGKLYLTLGDRFSRKDDAQKLDNHHGKIIRIYKDGSIPTDNPFTGKAGALPEIWSYGHRNIQGATLAPDGVLWTHEHGPQGGDEINLPQPGFNYGWPVVTYGENYGGGKIGEGLTQKVGMQPPRHYWTPSIAPSGMAFLTSERYGQAWRGNLFVGSLKFSYLDRIELSQPFGGNAVRENKLLTEVGERIREVRQWPDGLLYVLTDSANGKLIRLLPNASGQ